MSAWTEVRTIMHCDQCNETLWDGEDGHPEGTIREVRQFARECGWVYRGRQDLCPDCATP